MPELRARPQLSTRHAGSPAVLFVLVVIYLTPVGFLIYSLTTSHGHQERASRSFIPVVATVVESGVARRGKRSGWWAKITYRYDIDGHRYVSSRISFAGTRTSWLLRGGPSFEDATATALEHPVGSTIDAYYDPVNPSEAVRDVSPPSGSPWVPILWVGVLAGLFGLLKAVPRTVGPRIPDQLVTGVILASGLSALGAAVWFLSQALRRAAREDAGTALAFSFIGIMILLEFVRRRRARL